MKHITIIEDDIGLNNGIALALKQEDITFFQLYRLGDFQPSEPTSLFLISIFRTATALIFCESYVRIRMYPLSFLRQMISKLMKSRGWNLVQTTTSQSRSA